jgi:hypothetical protein
MTRWSAADYLRMRGYRVLEAVNVTEALGLATAGTSYELIAGSIARCDDSGHRHAAHHRL